MTTQQPRHFPSAALGRRLPFLFPAAGLALLASTLLLFCTGCGGCGKTRNTPADSSNPPPPMAVKDIQFGSGMVAVQNRIGTLTAVLRDEGPLSVYRFDPETQTEPERKTTPVQFYDFHFLQEELVQVQISYDTAELQRSIGRDAFFRTIESRYRTQEDFNASNGRRWINTDEGLEVSWQEDFAANSGTLTITWLPQKPRLERARNALRERRKGANNNHDAPGGVDIGI